MAFPVATKSAYSVSIGNWQQFALVGGSTMRMVVDGLHGDDSPYDGNRRAHAADTEFIATARPDTSKPSAELHRDECYQELRGHQPTDNHSSARDTGDKPERTAEGGWKWKGLELDAAADRIADDAIAARRQAEGRDAEGNYAEAGITPAMRCIEAELEHGSLVPDTERFALKSPDRFKEKLAKLITLQPDTTPTELASDIHDGIRYTFTFDARVYSSGVRQAEALLVGSGCELVERKPSWSRDEYKGINSQWRDTRSGQLFEVQFHTPESWDAKQRTHDAYEEVGCPTTPLEERDRLKAYQRGIVAEVGIPPRALEFTPYKAKGW